MDESYKADIYNYLKRARVQLDKNCNESLFYAAFELRCAVESRIHEYLNAREEISNKKKKGWKVSAAGNELENIFVNGLKVVEVMVFSSVSEEVAHFFHVPVNKKLRTAIGKLGVLLHAPDKTKSNINYDWVKIRELLEVTFQLAVTLSRGTLLAPLIESDDGNKNMKINAIFSKENPISNIFNKMKPLSEVRQLKIKVSYHDSLPNHSLPFLNYWDLMP